MAVSRVSRVSVLSTDCDGSRRRVRELRGARRWSLEQAAEAMNLDPTQLAKIEAGRINVTLVTIVRLADGFGVPLGDLFTRRGSVKGLD
ncbi:MAG TPA: helix-turn-helix transcriptional regulator [Polyangia bacterium]|nr:helix-turn-helix transcriptional regulator [Polyangia bacterium]